VSNAIAERTTALTFEQAQQFIKEPLLQLPPGARLMTWDFWSYFSDVLTSQLGLASRIRFWINHDDLTLDELQAAFNLLRRSRCDYVTKFPSDILDSLEKAIVDFRSQERARERKERQRRDCGPPNFETVCSDLLEYSIRRQK